jgi:S-adenosylmethionine:tRNA ribosyltransferase-isomerase
VPLPPYIRRDPADPRRSSDRERYQTVYSRNAGAVAAPTAGLHFTPGLLGSLREKRIGIAFVTLHVGPGTFLPVRVEDARRHRIHSEAFRFPGETARAVEEVRRRGGRVVAVGTTAARVLEQVAGAGPLRESAGECDLYILPGHRFRCVDALVTNFHLPRSTLLLFVAAFAGRETILGAYQEAVRREYRFYSYGDAMLIL